MREFLVSVTLVSLITSVSLMIMPEGGLKKYVKLAVSLAFCAFVVSSFAKGDIGSISLPDVEIQDNSGEFRKAVIENTRKNAEKNLKDAVNKKFHISENDIEVKVGIRDGENGLEISDVYVKLYGIKNTVKVTAVKKYAEELFDCEVTAESAE